MEVFGNIPIAIVTAGGTTAPIAGTVETWTVAYTTATFPNALPAAGTTLHVCDQVATSEQILVTQVSGTTWTVTRGAENTTPIAHAAGFTVEQVITAGVLSSFVQVINPVWFGADPSGQNDSTAAINLSIAVVAAFGGVVQLPPGLYLLNTGSAIVLATAGTVFRGSGVAATTIQMGKATGSSFSAAAAISIAADSCTVENFSLIGGNTTVTSNAIANGIELSGGWQHCRIQNIFGQYINGYGIESVGGASRANLDTMITNVVFRNCAGIVHVQGVTGSNWGGEHFLTNIQGQQWGALTGANANKDAVLIEDVNDTVITGINIGPAASVTGRALRIHGNCATTTVSGLDVGANGITGSNPAVHIDSSANGSPSGVSINGGRAGGGSAAFQVDAGGDVTLLGVRGHQAYGDGLQVNGTPEVLALGCSFAANNQGGNTGVADINHGGMTGGNLRAVACRTETAVGAAAAGVIPNPVITNSRGYFFSCFFIGSGGAPSTVFSGTPQIVRGSVGYNPRGQITAPTITASPFSSNTSQNDVEIIFTTIGTLTAFKIGGVAVSVVPVAGVPYHVPARQTLELDYSGAAPTWQWFAN